MSKRFLDSIAKEICSLEVRELANLNIILPSRRAGVFLKDAIQKTTESAVLLPHITTVEEFVARLTGLKTLSQSELLMELYLAYSKTTPQADFFEEFLHWGANLLRDFNDIDYYLINHEEIFSYLSEAKALETWNPDGSPLTEHQKAYIAFYASMKDIYVYFRQALLAQDAAYPAMAFRLAAESDLAQLPRIKSGKVWVVGLNALTRSEIRLFENLKKEIDTRFFWDYDQYYLNDAKQEAGLFARENLRMFSNPEQKADSFPDFFKSASKKTINIIGVAGNIGQAWEAAAIAEKIAPEELGQTAIVLNEERLMIPLLNALPEKVMPFNVSMGYPFRETPLCQFVQLMIYVVKQQQQGRGFYYRDLVSVINHQLLQWLFRNETDFNLGQISGDIQNLNQTYWTYEELMELLDNYNARDYLGFFFLSENTGHEALKYFFTELIARIKDRAEEDDHFLTHFFLEQAWIFQNVLQKLHELMEQYRLIHSLDSYSSVMVQLLHSEEIAFLGEPLSGMQVMGMLESRALDFKNLIMLSVNENLLPLARTYQSFLPVDFRAADGTSLPGYHRKLSVFAYHFYRLLQGADNVWLIYNTQDKSFGGGEESRFIKQLRHEMKNYAGDCVTINEIDAQAPFSLQNRGEEETVPKNDYVLEKLHELNQKGFSPSALNTYRTCSLLFYYKYILEIREQEEDNDRLSPNDFGSIMHRALENMYKPFVGKSLHEADVKQMIAGQEQFLLAAFEEVAKGTQLNRGRNLLAWEVMKSQLNDFLKRELNILKTGSMEVLGLEQEFERVLRYDENAVAKEYRFRGTIDRIDALDQMRRIIDYKSGEGKVAANELQKMMSAEMENCGKHFFQLMLYAWMYQGQDESVEELLPGIISFRQLTKGLISVGSAKKPVVKENLNAFEAELIVLMHEIFDPESGFEKTKKHADACTYCPFRDACGRMSVAY